MDLRMSPHSMLGAFVESYLGPLDEHLLDEDNTEWTRGLANWYRFNYCQMNTNHNALFKSLLSEQQKMAYCLLYDWWTASYCDPATSLASILQIIDDCSDLSGLGLLNEEWTPILGHLQLKRWPTGDIIIDDSSELEDPTTYNGTMYSVFEEQFGSSRGYRLMNEQNLHLTSASVFDDPRLKAWCQEAAWNCFVRIGHKSIHRRSGQFQPGAAKVSSNSITEALLRPLKPSIPLICACPWLNVDAEDPRGTMPYYLWDRKRMQTIVTHELNEIPCYTAISHTWGRWLKIDSLPIRLPGVPWNIPQNTRFEIEHLPQMLLKVPGDSPYIWFDLVCIPQDGGRIAQGEIARQAEIFRGAEHAIAWLNDVADFDCLETALQWLLLRVLRFSQGSSAEGDHRDLLGRTLSRLGARPSNLFVPRSGLLDETTLDMNSWFTSLWTLQELCLRPDMWLCSRDWMVLSIDGEHPLSISGIIVITEAQKWFGINSDPSKRLGLEISFMSDRNDQTNIAIYEIDSWRFITGLHRFLEFSRSDILAWADQRECTSRRAEAIMSALGVTDWYKKSGHETRESDLVLGKCPVAFVQELVTQDPGEFFDSFFKVRMREYDENGEPFYIGDVYESFKNNDLAEERMYKKTCLRSNMPNNILPFSATTAGYADARAGERHGRTSHPSLTTWTILVSGHVKISETCILASSKGELQPILSYKIGARFIGPQPRDPPVIEGQCMGSKFIPVDEDDYDIDLQEWARTRDYEVHAIVLSHVAIDSLDRKISPRHIFGFILRRLDADRLTKVGNYHIYDLKGELILPGSRRVDWLVC